jgi:hypothetical protein
MQSAVSPGANSGLRSLLSFTPTAPAATKAKAAPNIKGFFIVDLLSRPAAECHH